MQPLKVQAWLSSPLAAFDNWSPSLDSLLEWLLLDRLNLISPNPTIEQVEGTRATVDQHMPLEKGNVNGEWYWKTSSPCYVIHSEQTDKFRKRWDSHDQNLDWGKRKAKWSTSEGAEKSYDLPLYLRSTPAITWYCVGDADEIRYYLEGCKGVGKKIAHGHGQVSRWEVQLIDQDWHLWRDGMLMRPVPIACLKLEQPVDFSILNWGWRPPAWLHSNKTQCAMPVHTVRRLEVAR